MLFGWKLIKLQLSGQMFPLEIGFEIPDMPAVLSVERPNWFSCFVVGFEVTECKALLRRHRRELFCSSNLLASTRKKLKASMVIESCSSERRFEALQ